MSGLGCKGEGSGDGIIKHRGWNMWLSERVVFLQRGQRLFWVRPSVGEWLISFQRKEVMAGCKVECLKIECSFL